MKKAALSKDFFTVERLEFFVVKTFKCGAHHCRSR